MALRKAKNHVFYLIYIFSSSFVVHSKFNNRTACTKCDGRFGQLALAAIHITTNRFWIVQERLNQRQRGNVRSPRFTPNVIDNL